MTVSGIGFQVSGVGLRVSIGFRVSGIGLRVLSIASRVSGFGNRVSGFVLRVSIGLRVSGIALRVSGTGEGFEYCVDGFGYRVSGVGYRVEGINQVEGFGYRVEDFGCRVPGLTGKRFKRFSVQVPRSGRAGDAASSPKSASVHEMPHSERICIPKVDGFVRETKSVNLRRRGASAGSRACPCARA